MANIDRLRRVDGIIGPPLCWLVGLLTPRRTGPPPAEVRRILVIVLSEMGSLVLTHPMFERLRENHPSATFYVLCSDTNRPALDLLDIVPDEHVITMRTGSVAAVIGDAIRAVRRMRALRLDAVLDLELFARVSAALAGLSGAKLRVGFHRFTQEGLYRGNIMNRPVLYNPYQHIANQFVTLAEAIGSTDVPTAKREVVSVPLHLPPLAQTADESAAARDALYRRYPILAGRPLVFMSPGGGLLPIRAWPLASFAAVAQALIARGCAIAILGTAADRELAQALQRACGSNLCIDLTGYTRNVREVTVLLHHGTLLITNDGGIGHFAALTPITSIVFFGPETPVLYGSLSPRAINLHKPLSCSPCVTAYNHRRSPCDGNNVCLKSISPDEVIALAGRVLENRPLAEVTRAK